MGLDLQGLACNTVVAATRGVVALAEPFVLAGKVVYLNHKGGVVRWRGLLTDGRAGGNSCI